MDKKPVVRYAVASADDGYEVVDRRTGRGVVRASDRWLAESWAEELNRHARLRDRPRGDADEYEV